MRELPVVDKSWTLFLDRDGVINEEKHLDYVYNFKEFRFYPGVLLALRSLNNRFGRIVVVTNQRGVEKKLMSEEDLAALHKEMLAEVELAGGKIDAIFYCTSLDNDHPNRKPQPGMAMLAKESYPDIDMKKAIMVGNNISDMEFGRNAGMLTAFVRTTSPQQDLPHPAIDFIFDDLPAFAASISQAK